MDSNQLARLSYLFEKAVAKNTKLLENRELEQLYNEFINDGREKTKSNMILFPSGIKRTAN